MNAIYRDMAFSTSEQEQQPSEYVNEFTNVWGEVETFFSSIFTIAWTRSIIEMWKIQDGNVSDDFYDICFVVESLKAFADFNE